MLRLKLIRGLSDSEICREMRISRPTAAKRRREVFDLISEHLRLVPVRLHEPILNGISSILFREAV
jgi:DNA-directed RNA polymerase specialized sigma24 family protein